MALPSTRLPEITWTPIYEKNPGRRWWQVWKPRWTLTSRGGQMLSRTSDIFDDLPYMLTKAEERMRG